MLSRLPGVVGCRTDAKVAIIFDQQNRWALDDAPGPRNLGMEYENTVNEHYRPFWEQGIAVDVIDADVDLSAYQLVIAQCCIWFAMGLPRSETFVADRVIWLQHTGQGSLVNGPIFATLVVSRAAAQLLGIWAEEIDCLNDGERNLVQGLAGNEGGLQGPYQVRHLCELIHAESAQPLATYRDDFYRQPAQR